MKSICKRVGQVAANVALVGLAPALVAAGALYESPNAGYTVIVDDSVSLVVPDEERTLPLRIVFPQSADAHPLIVVSHGTFSSGKRYDAIARYWAARGYIVLLPDHADANYGFVPRKNEDMFGLSRRRVADMSLIVDSLDEIERHVPALAGRMNRAQIVAAGHSFGTQVAMHVTGMRLRNPQTGEVTETKENRFRLLILISDPGKMAMMPEDTWAGSRVPTFLATGTEDFGLMGDGRRAADYENQILLDEEPEPLGRYLLLIERGDHYFGGLIHKDTDTEPDDEGLAIFNALSTAFLDAYTKGDADAMDYLAAVDLADATGGRASLAIVTRVQSAGKGD